MKTTKTTKVTKTTKPASKKASTKNQKTLSDKLQGDRDKIELTAYYIWIEKGMPCDCDLEIWLEAENKVCK